MHDIFVVNAAVHQENVLTETHEHSMCMMQAHTQELHWRHVAVEYELPQLDHQYHGVSTIGKHL